MTIDEAIRRNEVLMKAPVLRDDPKAVETFKFNIAALKGIKKVRKTMRPYVEALLPGETED